MGWPWERRLSNLPMRHQRVLHGVPKNGPRIWAPKEAGIRRLVTININHTHIHSIVNTRCAQRLGAISLTDWGNCG